MRREARFVPATAQRRRERERAAKAARQQAKLATNFDFGKGMMAALGMAGQPVIGMTLKLGVEHLPMLIVKQLVPADCGLAVVREVEKRRFVLVAEDAAGPATAGGTEWDPGSEPRSPRQKAR